MRRLALMLVGISAALLAGCGGNMDDLQAYAKEVRARKSGHIEPIPKIIPYAPYLYDTKGKRDPFTPLGFAAPKSKSSLRPDMNRAREPLEAFPLDGLRMVGTISMHGKTFALIRAPDGVIHRVTEGNRLGQNYGVITAITDTEVKIDELVPDGLGGWEKQPASLALTTD